MVEGEGTAASLDSHWVLMEVLARFPKVFDKQFVKDTFGRKELLNADFSAKVADLIMVKDLRIF